MSETTYKVEFAKSNRSACKKCGSNIEKGTLRIGIESPGRDGYAMTRWNHPACFGLPRKYKSGPEKMSAEDFVCTVLQDASDDGSILPERAGELAEAIASVAPKKSTGGGNGGGGGGGGADVDAAKLIIQRLEEAHEKRLKYGDDDGEDDGAPPKKKKAKTDGTPEISTAQIDAYSKYAGMNTGELKDCLRWNSQIMTGKKDFIMYKVIDGHVRGRLAACPLDGGRLKVNEDCKTVTCNGVYDETTSMRYECTYRATVDDSPRWQPWYDREPTEEEAEEMKRMVEEAREGKTADASDDGDLSKLVEKAENLSSFDLSTKPGCREAAQSFVKLFHEHPGKTVAIPEDPTEALKKIGPFLVANKEMSPAELVTMLVKEFGFKEDNEEKAAKKEAAMEVVCKCSANGPLAAAFQEMSTLIAKQGDRNRSGAYFRAAEAIKDLDVEVTEENAIGFSKGKTKVKNIGKSTAQKMHEFLSTGTISALEELRAQ